MELHERLKQAREMAGYDTASAAARRFGFTIPAYLAHENGSRGVRQNVAKEYAKAFGVSHSWLLFEEGQPNFRGAGHRATLSQRIECDRELLQEAITAAFQCISDIDADESREFAQAVIETVERRQAAQTSARPMDLVRALALSAARLFSRPKHR
jgi:transcriptional regulator with XRE-family HTH domain